MKSRFLKRTFAAALIALGLLVCAEPPAAEVQVVDSAFVHQGSGAIPRTLADKAGDRVSVFDFLTPAERADVAARTLRIDVSRGVQRAIDYVVARRGGTLHVNAGFYRLGSKLRINASGAERLNGFSLIGDGWKNTEFVWEGGTDDGMLEIQNVAWPYLAHFRMRDGGSVPAFAIKIDCDATRSGGDQRIDNVGISTRAKYGLLLGHIGSHAALGGGVYTALTITSPSVAAVAILGNDTDGQHFIDLRTANSPIAIYTHGGRNISVLGGSHSNPTVASGGYADFTYFVAEGNLGGGAYTFDTLRIESGVHLAYIGSVSTPTINDGKNVHVSFSNIIHASDNVPAASGGYLVHFANQGTLRITNSQFWARQGYFDFVQVARTDRFVDFFLEGCSLNHTSPDTFGTRGLVNVTGAPGTTGGLRWYRTGNRAVASGLPVSAIPDGVFHVVGDDAVAGRFSGGAPPKYSTVPIGGVPYATLGTNTTPVAGTTYWSLLRVEKVKTLTGLAILNGTTVGTDKHVVALYSAAGGKLANSALAGTRSTGANAFQEIAFTAPIAVTPGLYYAALQMSGSTDRFRSIAANTYVDVFTTSATGTFGLLPELKPPSKFVADQGPIMYAY